MTPLFFALAAKHNSRPPGNYTDEVQGETVTLTRPLCIDGEFFPGEWETIEVPRDRIIGL